VICSACFGSRADANQPIARQHPRPLGSGTVLDAFGDDAVFCIDPFNAIPGRRFVVDALAEVEEAGADQ
jgi:hypothetical protein